MRVDVHTHLWAEEGIPGFLRSYSQSRGIEDVSSTGAGLLESMDAVEIQKAIAVALVYSPHMGDAGVRKINRYVAEQTALAPDRLVYFCAVNPRSDNAISDLQREIERNGAKGLKFHGSMQELDVDDDLMWPIYGLMEHYRLPILFHSGDIGVLPCRDEHTRATRFDKVACSFPNLPMLLGHAGRIDFTTVAGLLRKHENVYADISSVIGRDPKSVTWPLRKLLEVVKSWSGTTDHVLFGSDHPLYTAATTMSVVNQLTNEIRIGVHSPTPLIEEDVTNVRDKNAAAFLRRYNLV